MAAAGKNSTLRTFGAILALVASYIAAPGPAAASQDCPEATIGKCFAEYKEISAVAATAGGFAAIAARDDGIDLLTLDGAGAQRGAPRSIAIPQWLAAAGMVELAIKRLVPGADGSMLLVGWASLQSQQQTGVLIMIDRSGTVLWSEQITRGADTSVILYSAVYDAPARRFVVVGRHTNGADNGKCAFWSRAIIMSVAEKAETSHPEYAIGEAAPGFDNRIALQDIAPTETPGQFIAAGFATHRNRKGDGCQDDAMAVLVSGGAADDWQVGSPYSIGSDAGEVAFAAAAAGGERFLVVGHGVDQRSRARGALVASFAFDAEPSVATHSYPEGGGDTAGGDRYRVIVPLREPGSFLVAGSGSASKSGRNQGIWRIVPAALEPVGPMQQLTTESGSDILGAARGADGGVVAVGTHALEDGSVGWIGLILGPQQAIARERREPDKALPLFSQSEIDAGSVQISEREIREGIGFRHAGAKAGTGMELTFSLSKAGNLVVSALPSSGDVDMVLLDKGGRVVAFSSNLNDAGEYLSAALEADAYRVKLVAMSDTGEYEVRLTGANTEADVLATLQRLNAESRKELSRTLEQAGYGAAGNADIGFGGDTVRAVLASLNTVWPEMKPEAVEKFIVSAFSTEQ